MTRYEKIKNMSIEEMAEFIDDVNCKICAYDLNCRAGSDYDCEKGRRLWLEQEVDDGE